MLPLFYIQEKCPRNIPLCVTMFSGYSLISHDVLQMSLFSFEYLNAPIPLCVQHDRYNAIPSLPSTTLTEPDAQTSEQSEMTAGILRTSSQKE